LNKVEELTDEFELNVKQIKPHKDIDSLPKLFEQQCKLNLAQTCMEFNQINKNHTNFIKDFENYEIKKPYRVFVDNPPTWNGKCNSYVYNFKGRVQEASIKNMQLIL